MSKSKQAIEKPDISLAECIKQLEAINGNLFTLKTGVSQLIDIVEGGNLDHAKKVIEIFKLKHIIDNLTAQA